MFSFEQCNDGSLPFGWIRGRSAVIMALSVALLGKPAVAAGVEAMDRRLANHERSITMLVLHFPVAEFLLSEMLLD